MTLRNLHCTAVGAFTALAAIAAAGPSHADGEIVVATRYLQAHGVSHSHLYLYRENGKLLRQLTNDNSGQDSDPVFSPNGSLIVFSRTGHNRTKQHFSVVPRTGRLVRLATAPGWYRSARTSPYFTWSEERVAASRDRIGGSAVTDPPRFTTPDGTTEIVLREVQSDANDGPDQGAAGAHFLLRDLKTGHDIEMCKLPGFAGLGSLLAIQAHPAQYFLIDHLLRIAFFDFHMDSTSGNTRYALDLTAKRLVNLSPNFAVPIPLPGEPAFLTVTENRYLPIPRTTMTANTTYLERWDAWFHKVRYASAGPAVFYGASIYRPTRKPAVIIVRRLSE